MPLARSPTRPVTRSRRKTPESVFESGNTPTATPTMVAASASETVSGIASGSNVGPDPSHIDAVADLSATKLRGLNDDAAPSHAEMKTRDIQTCVYTASTTGSIASARDNVRTRRDTGSSVVTAISATRRREIAEARMKLARTELDYIVAKAEEEAEEDEKNEEAARLSMTSERVTEWLSTTAPRQLAFAREPVQQLPGKPRHELPQPYRERDALSRLASPPRKTACEPPSHAPTQPSLIETANLGLDAPQPHGAAPLTSAQLSAPPNSTHPVAPRQEHEGAPSSHLDTRNPTACHASAPPLSAPPAAWYTGCAPPLHSGRNIDLGDLASALTQAVRAGQHTPRYLGELPFFGGLQSEWLHFKAAYEESAPHFSEIENTARLRKCLRGTAKEAVSCLFLGNTQPADIMKTLEARFGRPDALVVGEMEKVRNLPRLTDNAREVCIFASKIANIVATVRALNRVHHLYNPEMVTTIVDKLTPLLRYRWYDFDFQAHDDEPGLVKMSRFLNEEAERSSRYAKPEDIGPDDRREIRGAAKRPQRTFSISTKNSIQRKELRCAVCEQTGHEPSKCEKMQSADTNVRWELAKQHHLCFKCLGQRHHHRRCQAKRCGVPGCRLPHHRLLHSERKKTSPAPPNSTRDESSGESDTGAAVVTSTWSRKSTSAYLKLVPVRVSGPKGDMDTYALLDDGSTVTLVSTAVADHIGAEGNQEPFHIEAVAGTKIDASDSRHVSFTIKGRHQHDAKKITAHTIKHLDISSQRVDPKTIEGCEHLQEIAEQLYYEDATPTILIGQDNWNLLVTQEMKTGPRDQPVASLSSLGWVLHGVMKNIRQRIHKVNRLRAVHQDNIEELVKEHFTLESLGIQPRKPRADPEQRALDLLEKRTRKMPDGSYEVGLLWKTDNPKIPDNYASTMTRLISIERKLDKDPALKARYTHQINTLISNGYAEEAKGPPKLGRTWYLPHFAVINPAKPDKLRVVHDAAAKTRGVCLNDLLLTGPDLLQSLPGVFMRFRQRKVAVTADIKDMFLRIGVLEEDRDALRFLWRANQREGKPGEYRMKSVLFGATSSPCTAIYIKNRNAEEHRNLYPEAAEAIVRNHYMDDYIQSFDSEEEARRIIRDVDTVHRHANFHLQKWTSNHPEVLADVTKRSEDVSATVTLSDPGTAEKILGLVWRPLDDTLGFNINLPRVPAHVLAEDRTLTKREALRAAMSLYDPLGLVAPVTIQAKKMLQEAWRLGLGWDDVLPPKLADIWAEWIRNLRNLASLQLPRCYPSYSEGTELELHTFCDASETTYAAAVYWRVTDHRGNVHVSLVAAKARVAPLKIVSIPRLELQAAVLASRLAQTVIKEHDIKPTSRVYWSDSRTVLAWLRAGPRVFKPFVAHRVAEIEENTNVGKWRWVPTSNNTADDATRETPLHFDAHHRWFTGPDFLYLPRDAWPSEPAPAHTKPSGEEKVTVMVVIPKMRLKEALPDVERFSSWLRLICVTGRLLQFIERCPRQTCTVTRKRTHRYIEADPAWGRYKQKRVQCEKKVDYTRTQPQHVVAPLEAHHLRAAEQLWIRALQEDCFGPEIEHLADGKEPPRDSRLRQLSLRLDDQKVLRIKSRIRAAADVTYGQQEPAILDGNHPYCRLYIDWVHRKMHHGGVELITNELRQHYWILRIRPNVRSVLKKCLFCRIRRATPAEPPTGDHPRNRLAHHQRPFTYTGLDYFGPLSITSGRRHEKRYVALFTCLTTRAVHLELAASLGTDSTILALRRMIARRGCPSEIWSDNGTNLRGADRELKQAALEATKEEATCHAIKWQYIPPAAPFMGGAWERLVRSVKTALQTTLHEKHPREEVLVTLLTEVEHTVNSRPLTHVSVSPEDPEALTPNHFLLGGLSRVPLPGIFTDRDLIGRQQWRHAQRLADAFWGRWMREVLPLLQHRREPYGKGEPLKTGDVVLIADGTLPRNTWPRGIVETVYPGADGVVRAVDVRTSCGILRRPTKKLIVLPVEACRET